jgi:uncharacterized protein (UPF0333 family)
MSKSFGFIALILVAGIVMYLYMKNTVAVSPGAGGKATPQATIDIVGVKNDLNAIAQAERRYWATNSKYVSIDDLRTNGDISMQSNARGSYQYSADYSDNAFRITATYSGEPIAGIPHSLNIDQNMEIREGP